MSLQPRNILRPSLLSLSLMSTALLLSACGSDSGNSSNSPSGTPPTTTASVTPSLGRIFNAAVEARCMASGSALGSGTTGSSGLVTLTLTGSCSSPVLVEVLASASSTYFDEKLGSTVSLPAGTALRAIVPNFAAGTPINVAVTALTEIATRQAIAAAGSEAAVTASQASTANSNVINQIFGTGVTLNILTPPTVVDAAGSGSLGTSAADRYAFYLAALAHLGSGSAPAVAVTDALASDLADSSLGGSSTTDFSYTSGNFSTLLASASNAAAGYASTDLKTELGLEEPDDGGGDTGGGDTGGGDTGGGDAGSFPDETITLPSVQRPTLGQSNDIAASEISTLVGSYTGVAASVKSPEASTHAVDSCSVNVSSNGTVTITADGVTISQSIIGTVSSFMQPSTVAVNGWVIDANAGAGSNMHITRLEINRHKLTYAYGYVVANTSQVPVSFTHEIKCWIGQNRAPGTAGSGITGNADNQAANASNFPANTVGRYSGWIWMDNGVSNVSFGGTGYVPADANKTCSVTVAADGTLTFDASGTTLPVSNRQSQIAGDYISGSNGDRVKIVDSAWNFLQAWDYNNAPGNDRRVISLNADTGLATLTEGPSTALKSWSCKIPVTPAALP